MEWLAELPPVAARLKFHGAEEVFAPQSLHEARETQALSAAICARIGFGNEVALDDNGAPLDGEMLHLARDTPMAVCCAVVFCWAKPAPTRLTRCRTR